MPKLRLDVDALTVQSFDTASRPAAKGTVFGEQCTCWTNCTCPGCPTCDSCQNTQCGQPTCLHTNCYQSCDGGCNDSWHDCTVYPCAGSDVGNTCNDSRDWNNPCCPL